MLLPPTLSSGSVVEVLCRGSSPRRSTAARFLPVPGPFLSFVSCPPDWRAANVLVKSTADVLSVLMAGQFYCRGAV
jgi:hypothetical protein